MFYVLYYTLTPSESSATLTHRVVLLNEWESDRSPIVRYSARWLSRVSSGYRRGGGTAVSRSASDGRQLSDSSSGDYYSMAALSFLPMYLHH